MRSKIFLVFVLAELSVFAAADDDYEELTLHCTFEHLNEK